MTGLPTGVLRRLRLGGRRGRDQDGAAVLAAGTTRKTPPADRRGAATTATPSAAMAVCDPVGGMHHLFRGVLPSTCSPTPPRRVRRAGSTTPPSWRDWSRAHADELAAVIVEPVVQGAGGMHFYHPVTCGGCASSCDEHGVLLIADEIATGFGRTGRAVRLRARRRAPGHPVPGQGADRRLHVAGRDAVHAERRTAARGESACSCTARPSWPTRWPARPSRAPRLSFSGASVARGGERIEAGLTEGLAAAAGLPG